MSTVYFVTVGIWRTNLSIQGTELPFIELKLSHTELKLALAISIPHFCKHCKSVTLGILALAFSRLSDSRDDAQMIDYE